MNFFYDCYTFYNNGEFEFNSGGDLGDSFYGKGDYFFNEKYLILNYNKTKLERLGHNETTPWKTEKDSIELNFQIMEDNFSKLTLPYANINILSEQKKIVADENGVGKIKLKKSDKVCDILISFFGLKNYKIKVNKAYCYDFKIYLANVYNGKPIKDKVDTLQISEFSDKYFKTINRYKKESTWNKIR